MANLGAFTFKLELFHWYKKNKDILQTVLHFFKLLPDMRFSNVRDYILRKIKIKIFKINTK
jgi:hypothetical protein